MPIKIPMPKPIAEIDGDEMTRVIWGWVKDELLRPFIELNTEYYDLGLENREATKDGVTHEAAEAAKRLGIAVKCATITPNAARVEEYHLTQMWKSPNATIRGALDGTIFRTPIITKLITPAIPAWTKPITVARHAYGDIYTAIEGISPDGRLDVEYHNTIASIKSFAEACFRYAESEKLPLKFSAKDTILKKYDGKFREVFADTHKDFPNVDYAYTLIDDAVARVIRSHGGFIWAMKNYDGDVMSDMVSTVFGSLAMMTSVLVSPDGKFEFEAAHGTVTRHYYRYREGETPSTNPVATIFAWSGALKKRGELDGVERLTEFAWRLENAVIDTIESGVVTSDLAGLANREVKRVNTQEFIAAVRGRL
ncbi:MAG: NADP-dependent isocitrate dehydrogenase [Oscillospiraceae bacterium]|jgi:isocitrate dehydrogenase|nr:NADP-dependent isocitrate dehydrogenase [Oscillospiraceae bacterium]